MLKKGLIAIVALILPLSLHGEVLEINESNFPDANFRNYLSQAFGEGGNTLETSEVAKIEAINKGISSLVGIEHFPILQILRCGSNNLQTLDVSNNPLLKELKCEKNQLTSINLTGCGELKILNCEVNNLTTLNVSPCTKLEFFVCDDNQITTLDVHGLDALYYFMCANNRLTSINVTGCTALREFNCGFNSSGDILPAEDQRNILTTIDVSTCKALELFYCNGNKFQSIDVSNLTNLKKFACAQTSTLTSINFSGCTSLEMIQCRKCSLPTLNVDDCVSLKELYCYENVLQSLDVSHNSKLEILNAMNNDLPSLDLSHNPELYELECYTNRRLNSLNLSGCSKLEILWAMTCNLHDVDLSPCPNLKTLSLHTNDLYELDLSHNPKITAFYCQNNHLIQLYLDEAADKLPKMSTATVSRQTRNMTGEYFFDRVGKKYRFRVKMPSDPTGVTENFVDDESVNHYISSIATSGVEKQVLVDEGGATTTYFVSDAPNSKISYNYYTNNALGVNMMVELTVKYDQMTVANLSKFDEQKNLNIYKNSLNHTKRLEGEQLKLYRIVHGASPSEDVETYLGEFAVDATNYTFTKSDNFDIDPTNRYDKTAVAFTGRVSSGMKIPEYFNEPVLEHMVESYEYEVRNTEGTILSGVVVPIYSGSISADLVSANGAVSYTQAQILADTDHALDSQNTLRVNVTHGDIQGLSGVDVYNNHTLAGTLGATDQTFDITNLEVDNDLCAALKVGNNTYGLPRTNMNAAILNADVQELERSKYSYTVNEGRGYYYTATLSGSLALADSQMDEYELVGMRAWRTVDGDGEYYPEIQYRTDDYMFFNNVSLSPIANNSVEGIGSALEKFILNNGEEITWPSGVFGSTSAEPEANFIVRAYYRKKGTEQYYIADDELVVKFGSDIPTGIDDVNMNLREVKSVRFVNLAGVESAEPFAGANIVVTTYTDGTMSTSKQMLK